MSSNYRISPGTLPVKMMAERDLRYVWHPWSPTRSVRDRLMIKRGLGVKVWDTNGREYIDASSLNSTCGYGNTEIVEAAERQLRVLHSMDISSLNHSVVGELSETIAGLLTEPLSRTMLLNSGSEGIEAALLIASFYRKMLGDPRTRIVAFKRGYHGSTLLTRSLSGMDPTGHPFDTPFQVTHVEFPVKPAQLQEQESLPALLNAFSAALGAGDSPLAVVVEPFLNVGGGVVLPAGFLTGLRELCDRSGAMLILDEVFTGIGRTGAMFAFQHEVVDPDIVVSSKGLASGYSPIAAVTARQEIYEAFANDPLIGGLRYGHTTTGHPVSAAVALATIGITQRDGLVANSADRGRELLADLKGLLDEPGITDVRGLGLVVVIEAIDMDVASALVKGAAIEGVLVRQQGNAVFVCPPLIVTPEHTDEIAEKLLSAGRALSNMDGVYL